MTKALDDKYSYQIDEHNVVHLFRRGEDWQENLTNPLISAIFKIETLEKENERLRTRCEQARDEGTGYMQQLEEENAELKEKLRIATEYPEWSKTVKLAEKDCIKRLAEAREIIKGLLSCARNYPEGNLEKMQRAEQFLKE